MGPRQSYEILKEPPMPTATFIPKLDPKREDIENDLRDLLSDLWSVTFEIIGIAETAAPFLNYTGNFFIYAAAVSKIIGYLSEEQPIRSMTKLMKKTAREEVARQQLSEMKSEIETISSRVKEMHDAKLKESDKRSHAIYAISACEKILLQFDVDQNVLWDVALASSSILLLFSVC